MKYKTLRKVFVNAVIDQFWSVENWRREEIYDQLFKMNPKHAELEPDQEEVLYEYLNKKLVKFQPILILEKSEERVDYLIDLKISGDGRDNEYTYALYYKIKIKQIKNENSTSCCFFFKRIARDCVNLDKKLHAISAVFSSLSYKNKKNLKKNGEENKINQGSNISFDIETMSKSFDYLPNEPNLMSDVYERVLKIGQPDFSKSSDNPCGIPVDSEGNEIWQEIKKNRG